MEIGIVVPGFSADGSDWCIPALRNLVQRLATCDHVRVLAVRYPYCSARYDLFGAEIISIGGGVRQGIRSSGVWSAVLSTLRAEHRRLKFDLLHAFWANETGALTAVAGRMLRCPAVVSLAGGELVGLRDIGYGGRLARTERWKVDLALRLARVVTAGSRHMVSQAGARVPSGKNEKIRLLPLGVDLDLFRPPEQAGTGGCLRLVQAASLIPVKDQETVLRAVARLQERRLPFRLEIVGQGALESRLRTRAAELGVGDAVRFLGELPHPRLPGFYDGASVYLQSSLHEAQGMALLEAAACGVPLIGTEVGVLPELSPDAAISVPVGDHRALADAVASLLLDPERGLAMGRAARRHVEARFDLGESVLAFRKIYSEIVQ